jgi:PAS domain S-box-containing protein
VTATTGSATTDAFDLDHADSIGLLQRQTAVLELIASGAPLHEVLTRVATALEELIEGSRCSILLLDAGGVTLHHGAAPSLPAAYSGQIDGLAIGPDSGSCGAAAFLGVPVVAEDIGSDVRWDRYRALAMPHGLRSCWSSPIRGRNATLGTFAVYHLHTHRPPPREQRLVERFTHLASVAIDHAGLYGALAESAERFHRAFQDNAVGMALTDLDGRVVKVNRALLEMLGSVESRLLGVSLTELVVPTPAGELERLARGGVESVQYEAQAGHADGRSVLVAVAASAVRGADGTPVHLSVNLLDVTQRRAAERERRARREAEVARSAAEAASRAKSEFVSALNHELRTPLQAITGFTELLGTLDLPAQRREAALGHIGAATAHILAMVDDLLDIAKIEAGALPLRIEDVDLERVGGEVLDLLAPLADEREVELRRGPMAGVVRADCRRLRQVLINLVTNGIRYNHAGGWVRLTADVDGSGVTVAVRDSGRGIPEELLDRLFTPFDRLGAEGSSEPGAGLGLVLARGLTEAMGGQLRIRTVAGAGTTAAVVLPGRGC